MNAPACCFHAQLSLYLLLTYPFRFQCGHLIRMYNKPDISPTVAIDPEPSLLCQPRPSGRYDASVVCTVVKVHPECYGSSRGATTGLRGNQAGLCLYSEINPLFLPRVQRQSFVNLKKSTKRSFFSIYVYVVGLFHIKQPINICFDCTLKYLSSKWYAYLLGFYMFKTHPDVTPAKYKFLHLRFYVL